MPNRVLSFDDFVEYLEHEADIKVPRPAAGLVIGVDVEVDSITMLEMVVAIEDLGAVLPVDLFLTSQTLADIHAQYVRVASAHGGSVSESRETLPDHQSRVPAP